MVGISHSLTSGHEFEGMQLCFVVELYCLSLWSLLARIRVRLGVVKLKGVFRVCPDLLRTLMA